MKALLVPLHRVQKERTQIYRISLDDRVRSVIIEHRWHVLAGERVRGVGNQHTGLTDGTISNDHNLAIERERVKC